MASVATFYAQIGAQLKGLLWKDGGPVIGIQLENEYSARGPSQGEEYILALKKLAIRSGVGCSFVHRYRMGQLGCAEGRGIAGVWGVSRRALGCFGLGTSTQ